jgi:cytoskeletal protein RodZ
LLVVDDPDDWFEGGAAPPSETERTGVYRPDGEDWLLDEDEQRAGVDWREYLEDPRVRIGLLVAAIVVVVLIGLAFAGVFSSSSSPPPPPIVTTPADTTPATTPATTTAKTPTATVPTATLHPGDTGTQVKQLQQALNSLGYDVGTPDGVYGPKTEAAVKEFQTKQNLTADGIVGPQTLRALSAALNP